MSTHESLSWLQNLNLKFGALRCLKGEGLDLLYWNLMFKHNHVSFLFYLLPIRMFMNVGDTWPDPTSVFLLGERRAWE